jgi:hypothetical protein
VVGGQSRKSDLGDIRASTAAPGEVSLLQRRDLFLKLRRATQFGTAGAPAVLPIGGMHDIGCEFGFFFATVSRSAACMATRETRSLATPVRAADDDP